MVVLIIALLIISGMYEAIRDSIQSNYPCTIFRKYNSLFWDPTISWRNKYSHVLDKTPAFFGSTTFFVFLTDAWHLFKTIGDLTFAAALALTAYRMEAAWELILGVVFVYIFQRIIFELSFKAFRIC